MPSFAWFPAHTPGWGMKILPLKGLMMMTWRRLVAGGLGAAAGLSLAGLVPASEAAAGPVRALSAAAATATTMTSRVSSARYDSWVTVTAHVRSAAGVPAGSVTFTDSSTGSVLDTVALRAGTARFTTASLAPGARALVAHYNGSGGFAASSSRAAPVAVGAVGADAVTYQVDARHDGDQARPTLPARHLALKWTRKLGGAGSSQPEAGDVSYPVIAGGRVFVTVENWRTSGSTLEVFNAATGAREWSAGLGGSYGFSGLAYDGQRIFSLNFDGFLTAFAASTGRELWATQLAGQGNFTSPPTAYDGVVYATGAGVGGTAYAVSEADGKVRWGREVLNGDASSPAVDNSGAYFSFACQEDYRFSRAGQQKWNYQGYCEGGGGSTVTLHGSDVYARGASGDTPIILSKLSGKLAGTFASATAPAFDATRMYTLQNGRLVASAPSGSPNHWMFGNGTLVMAPVVNAGMVYVGSKNGTVDGVSARTGKKVWSGTAGSVILPPNEWGVGVRAGMAVGDGRLIVAAGTRLTAFG
jgi:outer membrane protein assembly factor BamB